MDHGRGFIDFAGSTMVHSFGGWAAPTVAVVARPRIGKHKNRKPQALAGHSIPLAVLDIFNQQERKIKMHKKFIAIALISGTLSSSPALALGPVSMGVEADYASRYIWRGYDLVENNRPAFQPSATASYSPTDAATVSFNIWTSYGVSVPDSKNEWDEVDYTLSLDYSLSDKLSISTGYIFYTFPTVDDSDNNDTKEFYLGASMALLAELSGDFTVYYDHDNGKGFYANLGLGYSKQASEAVSFSAGANVGYMSYTEDDPKRAYYTDKNGEALKGLSDANFSIGAEVDMGGGFTLSNTLAYTIPLDDDINEADKEVWTLTAISTEF